jgi:hypothetical protein
MRNLLFVRLIVGHTSSSMCIELVLATAKAYTYDAFLLSL